MFADAVEKILIDQCTPAVVRAIEQGESPATLWTTLSSAGFLDLMTIEGVTLDSLFPIFTSLGRYAVPVPIGQTIAARALLARGPVPEGMVTLSGCARREADGSVTAPMTAFGLMSDFALVSIESDLLVCDVKLATRVLCGGHGSVCATLNWRRDVVPAPISARGAEVRAFNAALHAAAMAGAMERLFSMTLAYCNDRVQFGKPIGKFQAVQHQLSVIAEQVAATGIAAERAFSSAGQVPEFLLAAIAKARASMAAPVVAAAAHALHGAIGITEEFDLQLYSRRLHEWRVVEGSEIYWNQLIGERVLKQSHASIVDFVRAVTHDAPVLEPLR
jgi:hypothetical protein